MKRARIRGGIEVYDEDEGGGLRRHVINSIVKRSCELPKSQRLTTGCPLLDATLQGGLRTGHLHEIVGESNCGKTQLCLQLLLTCQWNPSHGGLNCKSLYINTEGSGSLTTTRLRELANFQQSKGYLGSEAMDNIYINQCTDDVASLVNTLVRAKSLLEMQNVKLLVIDSIANSFKDALNSTESKPECTYKVMSLLKRYAFDYNACIVLTNHVSDHIEDNATHRAMQLAEPNLFTSGRRVRPSLGMRFASSVNCRYFVSRLHGIRLNEKAYDTSGCVRAFAVVFSPFQKMKETKYIINQFGVWGIPNQVMQDQEPTEHNR